MQPGPPAPINGIARGDHAGVQQAAAQARKFGKLGIIIIGVVPTLLCRAVSGRTAVLAGSATTNA
jgi:hypothetical protein